MFLTLYQCRQWAHPQYPKPFLLPPFCLRGCLTPVSFPSSWFQVHHRVPELLELNHAAKASISRQLFGPSHVPKSKLCHSYPYHFHRCLHCIDSNEICCSKHILHARGHKEYRRTMGCTSEWGSQCDQSDQGSWNDLESKFHSYKWLSLDIWGWS